MHKFCCDMTAGCSYGPMASKTKLNVGPVHVVAVASNLDVSIYYIGLVDHLFCIICIASDHRSTGTKFNCRILSRGVAATDLHDSWNQY